jgi:hypothetical protein
MKKESNADNADFYDSHRLNLPVSGQVSTDLSNLRHQRSILGKLQHGTK